MFQLTNGRGSAASAGTVALVAVVAVLALVAAGAGVATAQTASTGPTVETSWADALGDTEPLFAANVTSLGDAEEVRVWIEYREADTSTWQESTDRTMNRTGQVTFAIGDLGRTTTYEYRAVVADGSAADTGDVRTYTPYQIHPSVTVDPPADVGETAATLNATLEGLGDDDTADVSFDYREVGSDAWQPTNSQTVTTPGSVTHAIAGLAADTTYEYRARAVDTHGDEGTSGTTPFTTGGALAVNTAWADSTGESGATVAANVTSLGDADEAAVWVEYREQNATTWQDSQRRTVGEPGAVTVDIGGLDRATTYDYRAVAGPVDGEAADAGESRTFTTLAVDPYVSLDPPATVGESAATLNATLDRMGSAAHVDVRFEYRLQGDDTWQTTDAVRRTSPGSVTTTITDLQPARTYVYRATAVDADGDTSDTYDPATFTTDGPFAVETRPATSVDGTAATLEGAVVDFGDASSAAVAFEHRMAGAETWSTVDAPVAPDGSFSARLTDLDRGETYEFRALGNASDGDSDAGTVRTVTLDTDPVVETDDAMAVGQTTATVGAELTVLGGADDATVAVEYRQAGASSWQTTGGQTLASTGAYTATIEDLSPGTDYEYRAVATAADGDEATGAVRTLTTESAARPPTIERVSATEDSPPNPHAEVTVDWAVADADGDLADVSVTISSGWGQSVASDTDGVAGGSATGSFDTRIKHGAGGTYTVTVTATDEGGRTATRTETLST